MDGTGYTWHDKPDGGATFPMRDGGWIYVSNSEVEDARGGVGAVRFNADADIVDAYPILLDTTSNCAGGPTPWGTWLSCEEFEEGRVWECDPFGGEEPVVHPAMGVFSHEAAAVDPVNGRVHLTEDEDEGGFYRYTPREYPDLTEGLLEVAAVSSDGSTVWHEVGDPSARSKPARRQIAASTPFDGGEGTWYDAGTVYFTTKGDHRVWAYDTGPALDPSGTRLYFSSQRGFDHGVTYEVQRPFRTRH